MTANLQCVASIENVYIHLWIYSSSVSGNRKAPVQYGRFPFPYFSAGLLHEYIRLVFNMLNDLSLV